MQIPRTVDEIEARALVMRTIATLKAKQAALGLGGLSDHVPSLIIWLEDSVREFDASRPKPN